MAGDIGFYQKPTRDLMIVTGSQLANSSKQTLSIPNGVDESGSEILYYSGQPLWVTNGTVVNTGEVIDGVNYQDTELSWTLTPQKNKPVYFAFYDSDEYMAADKYMGISTLDNFELQTPFFDTSKVYTNGAALTAKSVASAASQAIGNKPRVGDVVVTLAEEGDDIIGYVTKGVVSVNGSNFDGAAGTKVVNSAGKEYITGGPAIWTENSLTNTVLQFATKFVAVSA